MRLIILAPAFEGFHSPCAYRMYNLCYIRTSPHTHTQQITSNRASPKTNRPSASIIAAQIHCSFFLFFFAPSCTYHHPPEQTKQAHEVRAGSRAGSSRKSFLHLSSQDNDHNRARRISYFLHFFFFRVLGFRLVWVGGEVPLSHRAREIAKAFFFFLLT
jgi:hypothetical protein